MTLVLPAVRSSLIRTVDGEPTVEVLSLARTSPRSIVRPPTRLAGLVCPQYISQASLLTKFTAKSLVAGGLARRVLVQLSYAIGVAEPLSIYVDSYGTGKKPDAELVEIITKNWDLRPGIIVRQLDLQRPQYLQTASYGHFGMLSSSMLSMHSDHPCR